MVVEEPEHDYCVCREFLIVLWLHNIALHLEYINLIGNYLQSEFLNETTKFFRNQF